MSGGNITRTYTLPFKFRATFVWNDGRLDVVWHPQFPRITKPRSWKKFFVAYQAVRREFYQELAAVIGGNILIVDTPDLKRLDGMEIITMPTKH